MIRNKELTKEMLLQYGITNITEDGRIFKGNVELKPCTIIRKYKYSKKQLKYQFIQIIDKTCKLNIDKYFKGYYNYKSTLIAVHRAVYAWYNGIAHQGMDICHLDDNPENNHLSNLKEGSRLENIRQRKFGRNQHTYMYSDDELIDFRNKRKEENAIRQEQMDKKHKRCRDVRILREYAKLFKQKGNLPMWRNINKIIYNYWEYDPEVIDSCVKTAQRILGEIVDIC